MNVYQFLNCQPSFEEFSAASLLQLKKEHDECRLQLRCILQEGFVVFRAIGELVHFVPSDSPSRGVTEGEAAAAVSGELWIAERTELSSKQFPAALLIRVVDNFYFVDHTTLKSLSIQRSKTIQGALAKAAVTRGSISTHMLCFSWPLDLDMHLVVDCGVDAGRPAVLDRLTAIVNVMSTVLNRQLCSHPLFRDLWREKSSGTDAAKDAIKYCLDSSLRCSSVLTALMRLPVTAADVYAANGLIPSPALQTEAASIDNKFNVSPQYSSNISDAISASRIKAAESTAMDAAFTKERKLQLGYVDSVLAQMYLPSDGSVRFVDSERRVRNLFCPLNVSFIFLLHLDTSRETAFRYNDNK